MPSKRRTATALGFTLLETMIYVMLVGVILTSAVMYWAEFLSAETKASVMHEVTHNARFALERVSIEVREAQAIDIAGSSFGVNPGILSLTVADPGSDPTSFTVVGGALVIQQGTNAALPLTDSAVVVTDFTVDDVSTAGRTRAVRISITVDSLNIGNLEELAASVTLVTTVPVMRSDGFSASYTGPPTGPVLGRTAMISPRRRLL